MLLLLFLVLAVHHPAAHWHKADWEHTADGVLLSVWQATSRTPNSPSFPSPALCLPLRSLLLPSYTSSITHTHSLQHHFSPTRSPAARLTTTSTHTCTHKHKMKHLMVHGTFKEVTHMAPLHARIPPYILSTLQLTPRWQEILLTFTHTLSSSLTHTLSLAPSPVETVWLIKCRVSSLVSKSIRLQPSSRS